MHDYTLWVLPLYERAAETISFLWKLGAAVVLLASCSSRNIGYPYSINTAGNIYLVIALFI